MFGDNQLAPGGDMAGTEPIKAPGGAWIARVRSNAQLQIDERRRMAAASMAMFTRLVHQPHRRGEALQLLPRIIQLVEALYSAEESLLAQGARYCACRLAHHAVLRDLRACVVRLSTNGGAYDEFELEHAIDALLHEWIVSGRMGESQPATLR